MNLSFGSSFDFAVLVPHLSRTISAESSEYQVLKDIIGKTMKRICIDLSFFRCCRYTGNAYRSKVPGLTSSLKVYALDLICQFSKFLLHFLHCDLDTSRW